MGRPHFCKCFWHPSSTILLRAMGQGSTCKTIFNFSAGDAVAAPLCVRMCKVAFCPAWYVQQHGLNSMETLELTGGLFRTINIPRRPQNPSPQNCMQTVLKRLRLSPSNFCSLRSEFISFIADLRRHLA